MGRSTPTVVHISTTKGRGTDGSFVELPVKGNIGPISVLPENTSLESEGRQAAEVQTVATWKVMDSFDDGLKKAVIDFIDTTKEGVTAPHTVKGREKVLTFNFFGTGTKSIAPGEIGEFTVIFSYPPGATSTTSSLASSIVNISSTNSA